MSMPRILLVEDEPTIADTILYALRTEGFAHAWAATAGDARQFLANEHFNLIVLDVGLPDGNGFDLCRELRTRTLTPVLFLTARQSEVDRIVGLEIGGDDYVTKPFSPRELTARIRAILRRTTIPLSGTHSAPAIGASASSDAKTNLATALSSDSPQSGKSDSPTVWELDAERQRIRFRGAALTLTRNEYRLLCVLLRRPGRIFSREELLAAAWDEPEASSDRTVDAHVKLLRAKLRQAADGADPIETHRGMGYSLREESA